MTRDKQKLGLFFKNGTKKSVRKTNRTVKSTFPIKLPRQVCKCGRAPKFGEVAIPK